MGNPAEFSMRLNSARTTLVFQIRVPNKDGRPITLVHREKSCECGHEFD